MQNRFRPDTSLIAVEKPGRYTGGDYNSLKPDPDADFRFCLLFPDIYDIGISYYGFQILYHVLNGMEGVSCERSYLPWYDMQAWMMRRGLRLFSIEGRRPVADFDVVGITLQTELHYPGVVKALELSGIPVHAAARSNDDVMIIGGGPCGFHPEPVAPFFDAFLLGDGEEALPEMVELMRDGEFRRADRREKWAALAQVDGVYVPGLYKADGDGRGFPVPDATAPARVRARVVSCLKPEYYPSRPIVPVVQGAHDRLTVEIMRGCTQGCRFCQAGMLHRPVRERSVGDIVNQVMAGIEATGWNEVGLLSLSTSDYSRLEELLEELTDRLAGRHVSVAFPSLRPSTFTEAIGAVETGGRKSSLTFAVEAGSQRLRDVINKGLNEDELIEAVACAYRYGWKIVKLYFMVGLPTERMDDIDEGAKLLTRLQRMVPHGRELHVSVSPFIPKPHSVFAREGFLSVAELIERRRRLLSRVNRRWIKLSWHDPEMSQIEALLARGSRRMASVVEAVSRNGGGLEGWGGLFDAGRWFNSLEEGCPAWRELLGPIDLKQSLSWDHLRKGISDRFYSEDMKSAYRGDLLADCRTGECYNCGLMKECERIEADVGIVGGSLSDEDFTPPLSPPGNRGGRLGEKESIDNTQHRYRLYFTKLLSARYLGHRDLMNGVIRALRRAGTPLQYSRGYNPRPKVSHSPALPLGQGSVRLWLDFDTTAELEAETWLQRWRKTFPTGVKPLVLEEIKKIDRRSEDTSERQIYRLRFNRTVKLLHNDDKKLSDSMQELAGCEADCSGRVMVLQLRRVNGKKADPVAIGLKLAGVENGGSVKGIKVLSVTRVD